MDLGLRGKVALVHGAGGGLGGAIALSLAREGVRVAMADVSADALKATVGAVTAAGGEAMAVTWDLADIGAVDGHVAAIEAALGAVDILVNNSGGPPPSLASGVDAATWRKHFDAMVVSLIATTDRVLPGMRARKWGRVITSTSSGVVAPIPNLAISNALRLSLVGWSKSLAREVAKDGVTVNVVLPGRIATARTAALDEAKAKREGKTVAQVEAESTATIPVGRYGRTEEYGDAVTFLASERAAFITGTMLRVDGGMIAGL